MKILMLVYEYPEDFSNPIVSGEIKNPYYLQRELKNQGHHVVIASCPVISKRNKEYNQKDTYLINEGYFKGVIKYFYRRKSTSKIISRILKIEEIDIIHSQAPSLFPNRKTLKVIRKKRIPIIITAHGTYVPELKADIDSRKTSILVKLNSYLQFLLDKNSFKKANKIISVSKFQVSEMINIYKLPESKIKVITNGVDLDIYNKSKQDGREYFNKIGIYSKYLILFVGRLVRKKGIQYFLKSAELIADKYDDVSFLIVGGTEPFALDRLDIEKQISKSSVKEKIKLLMAVPESDLPYIYSGSDVLVCSSINYESIPTIIYESLASKTPVVAPKSWGIPEIISNENLLFDERDFNKIVEIVSNILDGKIIHSIDKDYENIVEKRSWNKLTLEHIKTYKEAINCE